MAGEVTLEGLLEQHPLLTAGGYFYSPDSAAFAENRAAMLDPEDAPGFEPVRRWLRRYAEPRPISSRSPRSNWLKSTYEMDMVGGESSISYGPYVNNGHFIAACLAEGFEVEAPEKLIGKVGFPRVGLRLKPVVTRRMAPDAPSPLSRETWEEIGRVARETGNALWELPVDGSCGLLGSRALRKAVLAARNAIRELGEVAAAELGEKI
jgi:hypothetical protein